MNSMHPKHPATVLAAAPRRRVAFSLIELLAVLAVMAILATLLVPIAGKARESARKAKVRVQFQQWTAAFEAFRAEYGYYPQLIDNKVNGGSSANTPAVVDVADTRFLELLSGRGSGAGAPPAFRSSEKNFTSGSPAAQNPRRIAFHVFAGDEIDASGRVADAFGNTDIAVVVDSDGDGLIPSAAIAGLTVGSSEQPAVVSSPPAEVLPAGGVRAGVVFFSAGAGWNGATAAPQNIICSWK